MAQPSPRSCSTRRLVHKFQFTSIWPDPPSSRRFGMDAELCGSVLRLHRNWKQSKTLRTEQKHRAANPQDRYSNRESNGPLLCDSRDIEPTYRSLSSTSKASLASSIPPNSSASFLASTRSSTQRRAPAARLASRKVKFFMNNPGFSRLRV